MAIAEAMKIVACLVVFVFVTGLIFIRNSSETNVWINIWR